MPLIKRLFLTCIVATAIALLVILLGPSEGLEALGGALVAYFVLLFHIPAGLTIAAQAYRIRRFDLAIAGIFAYFFVIYGIGIYTWAITTGVDEDIEDFVDAQEDPAGFRLRALGEKLYLDQTRNVTPSPDDINHMRVLISEVEDINAYERAHQPVIWYAASIGELDLVNLAIERGAILDDPERYRVSPLYEAVGKGRVNVVMRLAQAGANVHASDHRDVNALMVATEVGDAAMVEALLELGADVNLGNYAGTALTIAIREQNLEIARQLLDAGAELTPILGRHPVLWAYFKEDRKLLDLIASRPSLLNAKLDEIDPPLFQLFNNCEHDRFRELLELGATPNITNQRGQLLVNYVLIINFSRCSGFDEARADLISLMIDQGLDLNAADERGNPVVLVALNYKRTDSARRLVAAGAPITGTHGIRTFPILAAANGANDLIDIALEGGIDITLSSEGMNRSTPLYEAAYNGHVDTIRHLISRGATIPQEGLPLRQIYWAAGRHLEVVDFLLEQYLAGERTRDQDRQIRRGVEGAKNETAIARLDELGIR